MTDDMWHSDSGGTMFLVINVYSLGYSPLWTKIPCFKEFSKRFKIVFFFFFILGSNSVDEQGNKVSVMLSLTHTHTHTVCHCHTSTCICELFHQFFLLIHLSPHLLLPFSSHPVAHFTALLWGVSVWQRCERAFHQLSCRWGRGDSGGGVSVGEEGSTLISPSASPLCLTVTFMCCGGSGTLDTLLTDVWALASEV